MNHRLVRFGGVMRWGVMWSIMNLLSDQYLLDIITKGGASAKKSPVMPAWGNLKEKQVREIIEYIRSLASPAKNKVPETR